jgi:hypothetical protein
MRNANTQAAAPAITKAQGALKVHAAQRRAANKAEEQAAAALVAAATAAAKAAPKPAAKPLPKGSGAAVGVAAGAMDGQPHTKLAVEQARKAAKLPNGHVYAVNMAGQEVTCPANDPNLRTSGGRKVLFTPAQAKLFDKLSADLPKQLEMLAKGKADRALALANVPAKPKAAKPAKQPSAPRVVADRKYKAGTANTSKAGTWTEYMVATAQAHKSTVAAQAAHVASGQYSGKALDWKWMAAKGFIVFA